MRCHCLPFRYAVPSGGKQIGDGPSFDMEMSWVDVFVPIFNKMK